MGGRIIIMAMSKEQLTEIIGRVEKASKIMRLRKKNLLNNFILFDPRSLTKLQNECDYWKARAEGEQLARQAVQEEFVDLRTKLGKVERVCDELRQALKPTISHDMIIDARRECDELSGKNGQLESNIAKLRNVLEYIQNEVKEGYGKNGRIKYVVHQALSAIPPLQPNICATCLQDCKFDTIDPAKCNAYINNKDNKI